MPTSATSKRPTTPTAARPAARLSLSVQYATDAAGLPTRAALRRWARAALECPASVTVRYVDDAEGRRLNREFRGKDYPTNVLTFVYSGASDGARLHGDIVVCVPVVAREAAEQRKPLAGHHAHQLVHGLLHLQGYDHLEDVGAARMEMRETRILGNLGFPNPYSA